MGSSSIECDVHEGVSYGRRGSQRGEKRLNLAVMLLNSKFTLLVVTRGILRVCHFEIRLKQSGM